jgi:predicted HTH domain antitoxin
MTFTLNLPEDIAKHLAAHGEDPAQAALQALAIEGYRSKTLSEEQVRRILEFETRLEVHAFLKQHGVYLNYAVEDLQRDIELSEELSRRS